mgnify:CR=1 FL=1
MQKNNLAIILSGGTGKRFDISKPKQFYKLNNKTILETSVEKFVSSNLFNYIIVVSHKNFFESTKRLFNNKNIKVVLGGDNRQRSVFKGLSAAKPLNPKYVLIHDAVRPFFTVSLLEKVLKKLEGEISVIPSVNVYDSARYFKNKKYSNIPRENLKLIQTPQGYCFNSIYDAYKKIKEAVYTDDSMILYEFKNKIKLIKGEKINFKITTKEDYKIGKLIEKGRNNNMNDIRVGTGFDVHKFKKGKKLKIFGITIPFDKSLDGHSDADVGFHSIVDAILGGLCLGDIGNHFPPTDNKWKNRQSVFFMKYAKKLLQSEKFKINNLDITLICEKPKVSQYQKRFIKSVAKALDIDFKKINIKGTTTETLGFLGREEGIACQVSVTLSKDD